EKLQKQDFWIYGEPSRGDVDKWLLWEECKSTDPYSGDTISPAQMYGDNLRYDVEHIYPKGLGGENAFVNKTLCRVDFNRQIKQRRTPKECFGKTPYWADMAARAKKMFSGEKLARFLSDSVPLDFTNRMLNDTSYIATAAVKYLSTLYGGTVEKGIHKDGSGKQRIFVVPGQATARLRRIWGLNGILGPNALKNPDILTEENPSQAVGANVHKTKYRADHRHHAIDAFVIANCTPEIIQRWAAEEEKRDFARIKNKERYRLDIPSPYGDCFPVVREVVKTIIVSHRGDHRISGALHDEQPKKLSDKEFKIEIAANEKKQNRKNKLVFKSGENHHIEVFERQSKKDKKSIEWDVEVVTFYDVYQRMRFVKLQEKYRKKEVSIPQENLKGIKEGNRKPVISPDCRFALHKDDFVKIYRNKEEKENDKDGKKGELFRVVGINGDGRIKIQHHLDARTWNQSMNNEYKERYHEGNLTTLSTLQGRLAPVFVDVLGRIQLQNHAEQP
ncbi:MAG: hypothetical protein LBU65_13300, partial [Planctomycetaceae bacterium]|nr:hypothetical protein [Planctomycetaceae bacterium]